MVGGGGEKKRERERERERELIECANKKALRVVMKKDNLLFTEFQFSCNVLYS
jgi:hypothetical protein